MNIDKKGEKNENSEENLFDTCGFGRFVCYSNV